VTGERAQKPNLETETETVIVLNFSYREEGKTRE
jgi:hypothetical protein